MIYDYIDYGTVFADCEYIKEYHEVDGELQVIRQGPRAYSS